ncbi:MAG: PHP domain-containing protein, partial [Anaerolineales bacterium]
MIENYREIVGCIHIHSVYSDGTGTIAGISKTAVQSGLDYIMMTDHNNLKALKNGEERWYGPVLTIIGYEINDIDDANHYLAFGLQEEVDKNLPAPEYVRRVGKDGGFGIIAHPDEKR